MTGLMRHKIRTGMASVMVAAIVVATLMIDAPEAAAAPEACSTAVDGRPGAFPPRTIKVCAGVGRQTHGVIPLGNVHIERGATAATSCNLTVWVDFADQAGHVWPSKRQVTNCSHALRAENAAVFGSPIGTRAGVRARGHACVDLYFGGSKHSAWQRCAPVTGWKPL